jgi:hypothetical protein
MFNNVKSVIDVLHSVTHLLITLVILALFVAILFGGDQFGAINGVTSLVSQLGQAGFAGLITLLVVVMWAKK